MSLRERATGWELGSAGVRYDVDKFKAKISSRNLVLISRSFTAMKLCMPRWTNCACQSRRLWSKSNHIKFASPYLKDKAPWPSKEKKWRSSRLA